MAHKKNMNEMTFKELRKYCRKTMAELNEDGVASINSISRIELGGNPTLETILKIAEIFEVEPEVVLRSCINTRQAKG